MRKYRHKCENSNPSNTKQVFDNSSYKIKTDFRCVIFAAFIISLFFSFYHMAITRNNIQYMSDDGVLNEENLLIMKIVLIAALISGFSYVCKIRINSSVRIVTNLAIFIILSLLITSALDILNFTNIIFSSYVDGLGWIRAIWAFLICLSIFYLFYAIIGRAKVSAYLGIGFFLIFGIISQLVLTGRGERFLFADIMSVGTALEVVGGYSIVYSYEFDIFLILLFACFFICSNLSSKKEKWPARIISFCFPVVVTVFFVTLPASDYFDSWDDYQNPYLYHFAVNATLLNIPKPDNYSTDEVRRIIEQGQSSSILKTIDESYDPQKAMREAFPDYQKENETIQPNIITIMNESFADLTEYADLETTLPVLDNYNSIRQSVISGNLYVDIFGAGTADSEYTFFTGNSLFYVPSSARPYLLYITPNTPSIVSTVMSQGYTSAAIHPHIATNWNRNNAYPDLGFETFYDFSSFEGLDNVQYIRNFISDETTYQMIEELYENKEAQKNIGNEVQPLFIFDLTMQNHGGYLNKELDIETVQIQDQEGVYPQTEEYLSSLRQSDLAFAELVSYFSLVNEPTIICMYGDHQPKLGDSFYDDYTNNDLCSLELKQQSQITPFIIWANFDLPSVEIDRMSTNYLSTLLLECAGLETTDYNQYLAWLYKQIPVINRSGYIDSEGNYFNDKNLPNNLKELIQEYKIVDYNNMNDPNNRVEDLYRIEEGS